MNRVRNPFPDNIPSFSYISRQSPLSSSVMHTVTARQTPESVLCEDAEQPCAVQGGSWVCISDTFMIMISSGWEIGIISPVGLYFIHFKSVFFVLA